MKRVLLLFFLLLTTIGCAKGSGSYKDGIYTGEGRGHSKMTPIVVRVEIKGGSLSDIKVESHGESLEQVPQAARALEKIPGAMVNKNTTEIDGIAGATETSAGLKAAVDDALQKAKG
ncbi:MAG: FMN-binding protein [Peptoniphilus sp.]|nr:FMN-binding protein [Peptoniphilus sp.]MDY3118457.1 FMN-binding protein [Peptoniphilus sp.]